MMSHQDTFGPNDYRYTVIRYLMDVSAMYIFFCHVRYQSIAVFNATFVLSLT